MMIMMMVSKKILLNIVFNYCLYLIGFIAFNGFGNRLANGFFIDYTENSELIQQQIGHNITLQCSLKGLLDETKVNDITYYWYFKQCGEGSGGILNCFNTNYNEDWTQLPCEGNICRSELHLKNLTEKYSGLYKCSVLPKVGNLLEVKLVRTFQLDIKNTSLKIPEFLGPDPLNLTVSRGNQAVFQCRVFSEDYPNIKWFRRLSIFKYRDYESIHSLVYYNGQAYELLKSVREKPTAPNIYLSKLTIKEVKFEDEAFYACVAISLRGHNIREAYLRVNDDNEDSEEYWSDYEVEDDVIPSDPKRFWLLFLMPVGLALLPLAVYLCYIIVKRYRDHNLMDRAKLREEYDRRSMLRS